MSSLLPPASPLEKVGEGEDDDHHNHHRGHHHNYHRGHVEYSDRPNHHCGLVKERSKYRYLAQLATKVTGGKCRLLIIVITIIVVITIITMIITIVVNMIII